MDKGMTYRTIKQEAQAELIEKKSRFIGAAKPVTTEQEALDFINEKRSKYYDATHNVYAYIISDNNIARFSDDGEPSGTAGMPVMEVLKKEGLTDLVVVVTRYFGGTLLGAGGLIRTYGKSAKEGVVAAGITERVYCHEVLVRAGYDWLGKIRHMIENGEYLLGEIEYTEEIIVHVGIRYDLLERFQKELTELSNGALTAEIVGCRYIDIEVS
ncbi:MAG: YigZ family protein [Clostridia bacterium]|nr:YigZ family protein [Clostridia bacterium]MBQ3554095.1 YigZ family protein [Clostridia bacterium]